MSAVEHLHRKPGENGSGKRSGDYVPWVVHPGVIT